MDEQAGNVDGRDLEAEVAVRWVQEHQPSLGWLGVARLGPLNAVMSVRASRDGDCFEGFGSFSFAEMAVGFRGLKEEA